MQTTSGNDMLNSIQRTVKSVSNYLEPVIGLVSPDHRSRGIKAKVTGLREEGSDMYTLTLKPNVLAPFSFEPGQHVSIQVEINGRAYLRTFSISSSITQWRVGSTIELSIKRVPQGLVTNWIPKHISKGLVLRIGDAQGAFVLKPEQRKANNAFIACGSGLTPVLSILESLPETDLSSQNLLYSVSQKEQAPFISRLHSLARNGLNLRILESSTQGRIKCSTLESWLDTTQIDNVYACGPSGLDELTREIFMQRSKELKHTVPEFFSESFGFMNASANSDMTLSFNRRSGNNITANQEEGTLLENAEKLGLNPIYGCRAGICHQCIATKTGGRVKNLLTNQVSDEGKEDIQLCICVAETDVELTINERTVQ